MEAAAYASVEQERAAMIAAYALWQLRDLDPAGESAVLREARSELRGRLKMKPGSPPTPGSGRRHLALVGGEG